MDLMPYDDGVEDEPPVEAGFAQEGRKRKARSGVVEPLDPEGMDPEYFAMYRVIKFLVANTMMKFFKMEDYFDGDRERYYKHVRHVVAKLYRIETPDILKEENLRQAVTDICEVTKLHVAQKVCKKPRTSTAKRQKKSTTTTTRTPTPLPTLPTPVPQPTITPLPPPSAVVPEEPSPDSAAFSDNEVYYIHED